MNEPTREQIALAMFTCMLPRVMDRANAMAYPEGARRVVKEEIAAAWGFADLWIAERPTQNTETP